LRTRKPPDDQQTAATIMNMIARRWREAADVIGRRKNDAGKGRRMHAHAVLLRQRGHQRQGLAHQRGERHRLQRELDLTGLQVGQLQHALRFD